MYPNAGPPRDVPRSMLGPLGPLLGQSPTSRTFELPDSRLSDDPRELVYEEYRDPLDASDLRSLVALRYGLADATRRRLDRDIAWPLRAVRADDDPAGETALGALLARVEPEFLHEIRLGSGEARTAARETRNLLIEPSVATRLGMPLAGPEERLGVCRAVAGIVALLHELGVTLGATELPAMLFRLTPAPRALLVRGDLLIPPTADADSRADAATDLQALDEFVAHCLVPGGFPGPPPPPEDVAPLLGSHGAVMLDRAAPATEWFALLSRCLGRAGTPPVLTDVTLDRRALTAGGPVTVRWSGTDVEQVEVGGDACPPVTAAADGRNSGEVVVYPTGPGPLTVTAVNKLGEHPRVTEPVLVHAMPTAPTMPVALPDLAPPQLPPMPTLPPMRQAAPMPLPGRFLPPLPPTLLPPQIAALFAAPQETPMAVPPPRALPPLPTFGLGSMRSPIDVREFLTRPVDEFPPSPPAEETE